MLPNCFTPMGSTSRAMSLQSPSQGLRTDGAVGEALVRPSKVWGGVVVMADQQREVGGFISQPFVLPQV